MAELKRCERCGIPRDNSHETLCPICLLGQTLKMINGVISELV